MGNLQSLPDEAGGDNDVSGNASNRRRTGGNRRQLKSWVEAAAAELMSSISDSEEESEPTNLNSAEKNVPNDAMEIDNGDTVKENIANGEDQETAGNPSTSGVSGDANDSDGTDHYYENNEELPAGTEAQQTENIGENEMESEEEEISDIENFEGLAECLHASDDERSDDEGPETELQDNNELTDTEVDGPNRKRFKGDTSETSEVSDLSDVRIEENGVNELSEETLGSEDTDTDSSDLASRGEARDYGMSMFKKTNSTLVTSNSGPPGPPSDPGTGRVATKKRRRRRIIDDDQLLLSTIKAIEDERKKTDRILERRRRFGINDADDLNPTPLRELILDYDSDTRAPVVAVDPGLLRYLKPHQANGVMFMWESCFESLERIASGDEGNGCILGHCMGLGKTLQVVTLIHTLFCHEATGVKRVLVVCPMSTASNWVNELNHWLQFAHRPPTFNIKQINAVNLVAERMRVMTEWVEEGGVLVLGYQMFRILVKLPKQVENVPPNYNKVMTEALLNPGPDLVVCDEGHLLKNRDTKLSQALSMMRTRRRIVLTGTPLQNNLKEYYCMVNFVKMNLLGKEDEYNNRFVSPIINGQFADSNADEIREMKRRSHVLHKLLQRTIQRKDYSLLSKYLRPKFEFVLLITMTPLQMRLYEQFTEEFVHRRHSQNLSNRSGAKKYKCLFRDFQTFIRIYNHPLALKYYHEKKHDADTPKAWWEETVTRSQLEDKKSSNKMVVLFDILRRCEDEGDKLLVFSQSLYALESIEFFLQQADNNSVGGRFGSWVQNEDYFRIDGKTNAVDRARWCEMFNSPANPRARLFLISTKAGGLGINLVGANRVVLFDVCWNPSHDVQSIFRVYRFGQEKNCFIYRLIAMGTMEEKMYDRQVAKLSVAKRVVDEQQVYRHYSEQDLAELYQLEALPPPRASLRPASGDDLLTQVIRHNPCIHSYRQHDSLLKDLEEEKLSEDERARAWKEFEEERARAGAAANTSVMGRIDELLNGTLSAESTGAGSSRMSSTNNGVNQGASGSGVRTTPAKQPQDKAVGAGNAGIKKAILKIMPSMPKKTLDEFVTKMLKARPEVLQVLRFIKNTEFPSPNREENNAPSLTDEPPVNFAIAKILDDCIKSESDSAARELLDTYITKPKYRKPKKPRTSSIGA